MWLSLVERLVWDQEVQGSIPCIPSWGISPFIFVGADGVSGGGHEMHSSNEWENC